MNKDRCFFSSPVEYVFCFSSIKHLFCLKNGQNRHLNLWKCAVSGCVLEGSWVDFECFCALLWRSTWLLNHFLNRNRVILGSPWDDFPTADIFDRLLGYRGRSLGAFWQCFVKSDETIVMFDWRPQPNQQAQARMKGMKKTRDRSITFPFSLCLWIRRGCCGRRLHLF